MGKIKKSYALEFKHHVVEKFEQGATYNEIKETYGLDLRCSEDRSGNTGIMG